MTTVYFNRLNTSAAQIRAVLVENAKRRIDFPVELHSFLHSYVVPRPKSYSTKIFKEIYNLAEDLQIDLSGFYVEERDGRVEVKRRGSLIVDDIRNSNTITLHRQKQEGIQTSVRIIADIMDARSITRCNIAGSDEFKRAMKEELERREKNRTPKTSQRIVDAFDMFEECMLKSSAVAGEDFDRLIEALEGTAAKQNHGHENAKMRETI